MPISSHILLLLFTYWYYTSIDHKVAIIIVIVLPSLQALPFYLLSYYDRKYLRLLSLYGITEKYWALEFQSYSSSSFWHTDFFHKSKWLGGVGIWALAWQQHNTSYILPKTASQFTMPPHHCIELSETLGPLH